jgi:hypothetical protein
MVDVARAASDLVAAATREVDPRTLKSVVEKFLDAFASASETKQAGTLRALGTALQKAEGRGAQVLCLALGALVEGGASPELAWPAVAKDLGTLLDRATLFASAAVSAAKEPDVAKALDKAGARVAKERPLEADAWKAVPSRCLAAVACLTRSRKLRAKMRKDDRLLESAWPLSDVVPEVGDLLQALRIVDDETLVVLAPELGRGWRVAIDAMPSNAELYILLADALDVAGKRPDPKLIATLREGKHPKRASTVKIPFHLVPWTAVADDDWIRMEGIPADIPPFGKERVVILRKPAYGSPIPVMPSFESFGPKLRVVGKLSARDVEQTMKKLAQKTVQRPAKPAKKAAPKPAKKAAKKRSAR